MKPPRPRPGGRSARVVSDVLNATLEEIAEVGYEGLSFEAVATRAGVNKTTVYRRWATKAELVQAALFWLHDERVTPDTGSLRGDLLALLRDRVARMQTPRGRGLARALLTGDSQPELAAVVATMRRERPAIPPVVFERARARDELAAKDDTALLTDVLLGTIHVRALWRNEPVDDRYLRRLIALVLGGVGHAG